MKYSQIRSITDEIEPGTESVSRSITDEKPDVYVYGEPSEADESIRPSKKAETIAGTPEPEETFEEYLERKSD